jgi:hypothetical protein
VVFFLGYEEVLTLDTMRRTLQLYDLERV